MVWFFLLLALLAGSAISIQAGLNSELARWTGNPMLASLASFAVGTVALLCYVLVLRLRPPSLATLLSPPWWVWMGGLLGAFFVSVATILAPRLGGAVLMGLAVTGQLLAALVLDHYGVIGFPAHQVNPMRVLGAVLLIAGVVLIRRF